MRERITIEQLFTYDELEEEAKEKALVWYDEVILFPHELILQGESDYMVARAYLEERIKAHEYEFLANGSRA